jgi:hypothetical protein
MFRPKWAIITQFFRKDTNDGAIHMHYTIKSRWMNLAGHVARIEGKRPLCILLYRWEDRPNIKMDLKQTGYKSVGWI